MYGGAGKPQRRCCASPPSPQQDKRPRDRELQHRRRAKMPFLPFWGDCLAQTGTSEKSPPHLRVATPRGCCEVYHGCRKKCSATDRREWELANPHLDMSVLIVPGSVRQAPPPNSYHRADTAFCFSLRRAHLIGFRDRDCPDSATSSGFAAGGGATAIGQHSMRQLPPSESLSAARVA